MIEENPSNCPKLNDDGSNSEDGPKKTEQSTPIDIRTVSKYFDVEYASKTFEESMLDRTAICLELYLCGFKELLK